MGGEFERRQERQPPLLAISRKDNLYICPSICQILHVKLQLWLCKYTYN